MAAHLTLPTVLSALAILAVGLVLAPPAVPAPHKAEAGGDLIVCLSGIPAGQTLTGTSGNDTILVPGVVFGTAISVLGTVDGAGGDDVVTTGDVGAGGTVRGGSGDDTVTAVAVGAIAGTARVEGQAGHDTIRAAETGPIVGGIAIVSGGDGDDTLEGIAAGINGTGVVNGDSGDDTIQGVGGTVMVVGARGTANGGAGINTCSVLPLPGGTATNCS
ncbi:hypothetical protein [Streptomyces sp. NPDC047976]|uniref:hypothetical protein n=1 Tax=Streptomyces sp. NPDC047976 TaxID=3155746 RepID=UPI00341EDCA7